MSRLSLESSVPQWRKIQRQSFTCLQDLADFLQLKNSDRNQLVSSPFALLLPPRLARKIKKGTLDDPILRQFVPTHDELLKVEGFVKDPVKEAHLPKGRLLQKYEGRVLLSTSSACAMNCRYCFRRHFDYPKGNPDYALEMAQIKEDTSLSEVILSGGDPLSLSNEALEQLLLSIDQIPHIKRIRFHSRFVVGIPERIDHSLLNILQQCRSTLYFVLHINHPQELGDDLFKHLDNLKKIGVTLLNQAVLLKGINDDLNTLQTLFLALVDSGILPYYLHQLDPVEGAAHFQVEVNKGKKLVDALHAHLPGYAIPRYVAEIPYKPSKTLL